MGREAAAGVCSVPESAGGIWALCEGLLAKLMKKVDSCALDFQHNFVNEKLLYNIEKGGYMCPKEVRVYIKMYMHRI